MAIDSFRELESSPTSYSSHPAVDEPHYVEDLVIPALSCADEFKCQVGFFRSSGLRELSYGLVAFIENSDSPIKLLVSPYISAEDQKAIEDGLKQMQEVAETELAKIFEESNLLDDLQRHTKKCLAYLIANERLQMKVVFGEKGQFHVKEWIFKQGDDVILLKGSANLTAAGTRNNYESMDLSLSWLDDRDKERCEVAENIFEKFWDRTHHWGKVVDMPDAVREKILLNEDASEKPSFQDFEEAYMAYKKASQIDYGATTPAKSLTERKIEIPDYLNYESGDFQHQGKAVKAWEENNRQGILAIATGGGKTITSLIAAAHLSETLDDPLLIIIACPTLPLCDQWAEEVKEFNLQTAFPSKAKRSKKNSLTEEALKRLFTGMSQCETIICTTHLLCDPQYQSLLQSYPGIETLLIADEVHNFGVPHFLNNKPEWINYRMGLSATPVRQYDEEGTDELFVFCGGSVVFSFSLEDAIGKCLTPYKYVLHDVQLDEEEFNEYKELSDKISKMSAIGMNSDGDDDPSLVYKIKRKKILDTAAGKLPKLKALLSDNKNNLIHTLVYASDKDPEHIKQIHEILDELNITYHAVTEKQSGNSSEMKNIIEGFRGGHTQILTAKRVLDEGVNIPEIRTAFVLSSTTTSKQWIQRRGRILRKCEGKQYATLHDFIALPPREAQKDKYAKKLVFSELKRCEEFCRLAENINDAEGPLNSINLIKIDYI